VLPSLFLFLFIASALCSPIEELKREQTKIKAKHFSRMNGGIKGKTLYIYNNYNNKEKKIVTNSSTTVSVFLTTIDKSNFRKNKDITVTKFLDNIDIHERGIVHRNRKKTRKDVLSERVGKLPTRVKNIVIYERNLKVKVLHRGER